MYTKKNNSKHLYAYDRSLPWLGTDTSIKTSGGVELFLWDQTSSPSEQYWVLKRNR